MSLLNRMIKFSLYFLLLTIFFGCAATQHRESTGQYVDDSVVTVKVKAAIFSEPTLKALQINVETFKGIVQLSGFVDSTQSAQKAGEVAARIEGVKEVKNHIVVK